MVRRAGDRRERRADPDRAGRRRRLQRLSGRDRAHPHSRRQHGSRRPLATRIGANDAPDIIGPIGIRGLQSFGDQLLDLGPYIESSDVDLSDIDQGLIDAYNVDGTQIGIPMAVYSS
ncbi:MAG: hypothetical protein L0221_11605, partial [Chloroflexi bacterium]|nr:hypothetical protein [Chloroflexota bacterium]